MPKGGFYNENRNRSFPFQRGTVGVDVPDSGPVTMNQLPEDWIVDCGFVTGPESDFEVDEDSIYLQRIWRDGDTISFQFESDAAELYEVPLVFERDVADDLYAIEHVDSDVAEDSSVSDSNAVDGCRDPLWSGYLITGDMDSVVARLGDGEEIVRTTGDALVEPALVQNLANSVVNSFELANGDRTRVTGAEGCDDPTWPHQTGVVFESARCLQGDVLVKPGYNAFVRQNDLDNSLTIGAVAGLGEGEPCEEVPLFDGESPPNDATNSLLEGGLLCNETLRSLNGRGGPTFTLLAGTGVSIVPVPGLNKIIIDLNLVDLAICAYSDFSTFSESV